MFLVSTGGRWIDTNAGAAPASGLPAGDSTVKSKRLFFAWELDMFGEWRRLNNDVNERQMWMSVITWW